MRTEIPLYNYNFYLPVLEDLRIEMISSPKDFGEYLQNNKRSKKRKKHKK